MHMLNSPAAITSPRLRTRRGQADTNYQSESAQRIIRLISQDINDAAISASLHFTPGVVERVERQMGLGLHIVADTGLVYDGMRRTSSLGLPVTFSCFIEDADVVTQATARHITRAEVAADRGAALQGPKLFVIGSAPMALNRLIQLHSMNTLREAVIIAAPTGFANVIELKERLWESGLPCIVARGRRGGAATAIAVVNALLSDAASQLT